MSCQLFITGDVKYDSEAFQTSTTDLYSSRDDRLDSDQTSALFIINRPIPQIKAELSEQSQRGRNSVRTQTEGLNYDRPVESRAARTTS